MKNLLLLLLFCLSLSATAQQIQPEWYILEKGATVGIIKPGVNDITLQLATSGNKPINQEAVNAMIERTKFSVGSIIIVFSKVGNTYVASDMEGRNLVVRGNITKVERGSGCTVGFTRQAIQVGNVSLKREMFVWIKELKGDNALIQGPGGQSATVPMSKLYDINATTLDMAKTTKFKKVE